MPVTKNKEYSDVFYTSRAAKNKAFKFIPAERIWNIDINSKMDVGFIHNAPISVEQKEDLLALLAFRAENASRNVCNNTLRGLRYVLNSTETEFTPESFDRVFFTLCPNSYRPHIFAGFKSFIALHGEFRSQTFNVFFLNRCVNHKLKRAKRRHLDPIKGAHTPTEFDSVIEGTRIIMEKALRLLDKRRPFKRTGEASNFSFLSSTVMWVLMMSIVRRPIQLHQIKMGDFRTRQGTFDLTFNNSDILLDYDELKLQTFRTKRRLPPRTDVDTDLHLLNRQISQLIIKYSTKLFQEQIIRLENRGIILTKKEKKELFKRYPLLPASFQTLSTSKFNEKKDLFNFFHFDTLAGHINPKSLETLCSKHVLPIIESVYSSERVTNHVRPTGNNRIRHTILTSMAREGVDRNTLAAITGVSVSTVQCYVDMTPIERIWIDETLGKNASLATFGQVRIQDKISKDNDIAFNDYGDVFGIHEESSRCSGCRELLPVPLACYGCGNFIALTSADHYEQLKRAQRKYEFNIKNGQSEKSIRRLKKAIDYIKITIAKCEDYNSRVIEANAK
ncbi:hypothetical protein [Vibrio mediterranei]|uniref:hypothetical protein n=1 Tax=Vibrio mediterranei TaxID=689 RepID=UPI00148DE8CC|nr:hypothetical protein [Vibrio mediterranei]NOI25942.1 hypothetical protein [Vibrio mediterranei]